MIDQPRVSGNVKNTLHRHAVITELNIVFVAALTQNHGQCVDNN